MAARMPVARHLYRSLLRCASAHDQRPALKALLVNQGGRGRTRVYDRQTEQWTEVDGQSDITHEELGRHSSRLFGAAGRHCDGLWYNPATGHSCVELVRSAFREELDVALDGPRAAPSERLDVAFAALRQLDSNLGFGGRVLSGPAAPGPEPAAAAGAGGPDGLQRLKLLGGPLHAGCFLHSHPLQNGSAFWRTVALVCEYDQDHGAMALVVNRPTGQRFGEVTADSDDPLLQQAAKTFAGHVLYYGGPVNTNSLFFLHTSAASDGVLTGVELLSYAAVELMLSEGRAEPKDFRLFAGYVSTTPFLSHTILARPHSKHVSAATAAERLTNTPFWRADGLGSAPTRRRVRAKLVVLQHGR